MTSMAFLYINFPQPGALSIGPSRGVAITYIYVSGFHPVGWGGGGGGSG